MSLFLNAHKLPSIDGVIEHCKYFSVTLKIARTLESIFVSFSAQACLPAEAEPMNMIIYTHPSPCIFCQLLYEGEGCQGSVRHTALHNAELAWGFCCPWCVCMLGAGGGWLGQWFGEKLRDLGQRGSSTGPLPCHVSRLLHLCSSGQNTSLLFLHIFKGLPSPEELLMQMIYGKACPSPSSVFCETPHYIAVLLHRCVSSLGVRIRGHPHPSPPKFCKMPLVRGREFI